MKARTELKQLQSGQELSDEEMSLVSGGVRVTASQIYTTRGETYDVRCDLD